jgi:hypothetical protein
MSIKPHQSKHGVFGSTERRFVYKDLLKVPGPGTYNQDLAYGSKNSIGATSSLLRERSQTQQAIRSQTQQGKRSAPQISREIRAQNIV